MGIIIIMRFAVIVALLGLASAMREDPPTAADTPSSGYFGADEDEVLNKDGCQKACAEIMLVTKQLSEAKMESYMGEFYPRTWAKFDLNDSGEIDITESHTFMRSLLGRLNQFVLAPGSLTDIAVE